MRYAGMERLYYLYTSAEGVSVLVPEISRSKYV